MPVLVRIIFPERSYAVDDGCNDNFGTVACSQSRHPSDHHIIHSNGTKMVWMETWPNDHCIRLVFASSDRCIRCPLRPCWQIRMGADFSSLLRQISDCHMLQNVESSARVGLGVFRNHTSSQDSDLTRMGWRADPTPPPLITSNQWKGEIFEKETKNGAQPYPCPQQPNWRLNKATKSQKW